MRRLLALIRPKSIALRQARMSHQITYYTVVTIGYRKRANRQCLPRYTEAARTEPIHLCSFCVSPSKSATRSYRSHFPAIAAQRMRQHDARCQDVSLSGTDSMAIPSIQ